MSAKSVEFLDALLNLPGLRGPHVSHDGRWVAWSWMRVGDAADVFLAPTDGSAPPRRLTQTSQDTYVLGWSRDGASLLVEQDNDGDERSRIFLIPITVEGAAEGQMTRLNEADPNYFMRGGALDPTGRFLIYGANLEPETGAEIEETLILRHDLDTGARRVLARPERPGLVIPRLSPRGDRILYPRQDRHPSGQQIWLVGVDGEGDRCILDAGERAKVEARWLPDGDRIVFLAEAGTHRRVGLYHIESDTTQWLIDDPSRNFEDLWAPENGHEVVLWEVREGRGRSVLLEPESGREVLVDTQEGNLQLLAPTPEGRWLGVYYSARQPSELVLVDPGEPSVDVEEGLTRLGARTTVSPEDLARAESITWESVDGLKIQGWLYRAKGEPRGTIVYVHGGPTAMSEDALRPEIQFYVAAGFNVLDPNYRGSKGFGLAFQDAIKEDGWGGREQEDIRAGIRHLIDTGLAQPGKVGMTGTSYGGYSSWHGITHFKRAELAASAPVCGMTDLVVDYETTRPDLRPYSEEMMGGSPSERPEIYRRASPIHFVGDIEGALLIVQGASDPNVTPENVHAVREALDAQGVAYGALIFDDEGHGISRPANQKRLYRRLVRFFSEAFEG